MNTTVPVTAPDFPQTGKRPYPSSGKRIGPAWQYIWDRLRADPSAFQDGIELARNAATSANLHPNTALLLLNRAHRVGLLDMEYREVTISMTRVTKGGKTSTFDAVRNRAFYRISESSHAV